MKFKSTNTILKILIILIPLAFMQFIFYSNFLADQDFNYFYDIGSQDDNFLSPETRISDKINSSPDYRNLIDGLVYFNIPVQKNSDIIDIQIKFQDNFPTNTKFSLGAKDQEEWHYAYNILYSQTIEELIKKYSYQTQDNLLLFKLNSFVENYSINNFLTNTPQVKLATNQEIAIPDFKLHNYQPAEFIIDTAIRGSPIFYVYVKRDFEVSVWKRDLNWYDEESKGEDTLDINLYNLEGELIVTNTIKDDREDDKEPDKDNDKEETATLYANNLEEGVYKLELKNNGDMLITKIKLNQDKIILNKEFFPAQSVEYFNDFEETSIIYFKILKQTALNIKTWHDYATNQTIRVETESLGIREDIEIKRTNKDYIINLPASNEFYQLSSKKNDILIKGPKFFSFSRDSWFNPFQGQNIKFKQDITYLENNADYVLVKYKPVEHLQDNWKIASTSFNISELYVTDNKLSLMFNTPHLNQNQNATNTKHIAIDYINTTVHKPALIK